MTSPARIAANRRNAARSTGPRTPAGKAKVAQNARKHGLNTPIDKDHAHRGRALQIAAILADGGPITAELVDYATWYAELDRIRLAKEQVSAGLPKLGAAGEPSGCADAISQGFTELEALQRYERRITRALRKAAQALSTASENQADGA